MVGALLGRILLVTALLLAESHGRTPRDAMREDHYRVENTPRRSEDRNRVHFGDFPFIKELCGMVRQVFIERRPDAHVCEGAVVSQYWVVSSAQMVSTVPVSVRDGIKVRAGSLENGRGGVLHETTKVATHPLFDEPHMYENDIALIKVKTPFTHDNYVKPIRMATLEDELPSGTAVKACGWGKGRRGGISQYLLHTTLYIVSNKKCDSSSGIARLRERLGPQVRITDTMMCAAAYNRDTTTGDSGGPLFLMRGENPLLVGIISWGEGKGDQDSPGVYTSVAKFRKWMFLEMASAGLLLSGAAANDTAALT